MADERKCPNCGATDLLLIDAKEAVADWEVRPYEVMDEEFDEFWVCQQYRGRLGIRLCGWHELADPDEALEEHVRQIEWITARMAEAK